ncbi:hypothetical protein HS125_12425 [bacterium]|nr:hypothetical protein [bacterium]
MGVGYHLHCPECGLDRHVLLGQGDDAFYEFCEEALFYCEDCRELEVVTVPISAEDLQLMLEGDFSQPWSKLTLHDNPDERRRMAEQELVKILVGYYDRPECPRCLGINIRRLVTPVEVCPRCGGQLATDREMLWE